jgi:hypothetical protein
LTAGNNKHKTILVIPDLQIPFQHAYALTFLKSVRDEYNPDLVVCVGDEWDNCALSRYPKDPDGMSAGDEYRKAKRASRPYYEAFPNVYLCESNHRERLYKRAYEAGIPREMVRETHAYMGAPEGWVWADQWVFDGIIFEHGDRASGANAGEKLIDANHASVVYGHHHDSPGITYRKKANKILFAMNVGCLIEQSAYSMSYTKHNRNKPVLSCGIIIDGVPQIIPMLKGLRER